MYEKEMVLMGGGVYIVELLPPWVMPWVLLSSGERGQNESLSRNTLIALLGTSGKRLAQMPQCPATPATLCNNCSKFNMYLLFSEMVFHYIA